MLKLLFATSEVAPLIKTGGLADVSGALPRALHETGVDVRLVMPAYTGALGSLVDTRKLGSLMIRGQTFTLWQGRLTTDDTPMWLLDCPALYDRLGDPYHDARHRSWDDNAWRFGCYCEAVARLAAGESTGWRPDVVHCNDWQTGLVPAWLSRQPAPPRTVFTIHNLAYQGLFDHNIFAALGLPPEWWSVGGVEFYGKLSFLKAGIVYADLLTTVSPTYAREIQGETQGCGLDGLLRERASTLHGILNGIDTRTWNPATDLLIAQRYSQSTLTEGKRRNRQALRALLGLQHDDAPVVGMIGRLTHQKGTDLALAAIPGLLELGVQLAILGKGDPAHETALLEWARRHPGRIGVRTGYDEQMAHLIEAGVDLFLMPSRFEPCGLNQMYSQRYGTLPVVHRVGGLADTVADAGAESLRDGTATGVCFEHASVESLLSGVRRALDLKLDPATWRTLQLNGMRREFDWETVAERYLELYHDRP